MKKITLAALSLAVMASTSAFAADYKIGEVEPKAPKADPATFTYKAEADRAGFVKNDFEFTVSANSAIRAVENGTRSLAVGAVSTRGRNVFTGHSDGGSVSQCGPSLTKTEADTDAKLLALLAGENLTATDSTAVNGCGIKPTA